MNSSPSTSERVSHSRTQIQGLTRQSAAQSGRNVQVADQGAVSVKARDGLPITILKLLVLAACCGAFAALMTSCRASRAGTKAEADSGAISTGLSNLNATSKQPKLNTPLEIAKDSNYQQLADQAKMDYETLFARDPKQGNTQRDAAPSSGLQKLNSEKPPVTPPLVPVVEAHEQQPAIEIPAIVPVTTMTTGVSAITAITAQGQTSAVPEIMPPMEQEPSFDIFPHTVAATSVFPGAAFVPAGALPPVVTEERGSQQEPIVPMFKGVNALLASRVTGFGRYVPLASRPGHGTFVFQSARSNRAIVYIEIENFGYRAVKEADPDRMPGDQWAVDLSTEIRLLDAFDGMLQMKEAERSVIETGRNKRKDFYLVQEIELPPTLTIGRYNLKVVLRDRSGVDAVRTEAIIPIQIVADLTVIEDER